MSVERPRLLVRVIEGMVAYAGSGLLMLLLAMPALAEGPAGCPAPEARQFDFWAGEWNVVNRSRGPQGWGITGEARARVYPILDGCAMIEHWQGTAHGNGLIGFSMRAWDAETGKWVLVLSWPAPDKPGFSSLEGEFRHGRGEFFSEIEFQGKKMLQRYSFSDATADSLRWDAAYSQDGGANWFTQWIMEFSRRDPKTELPLFNGPWVNDGRASRCTQKEAHLLDFMAGAWIGTRKTGEGEGTRVRSTHYPIVGGCALMEHLRDDATGYERFSVRAFESKTEAGEWVEYVLDSHQPVPLRRAGKVEGKSVTFAPAEGSEATTVTWRLDGEKLIREERRGDTVVESLELESTYYDHRLPMGQ